MPNHIDPSKVPAPRNTCFIITPSDPKFAILSRLIADITTTINLTPISIANISQSCDFINDIESSIRSAQIVVALCGSAHAHTQPNQHVIYALGFAYVLGKSILLVKERNQQPPLALISRRSIEYSLDEIANPQQRSDWALRLKGLLDKMSAKIDDVHDLYSFWSNIQTVLSFAKDVHHHLQTLENISLDILVAKAAAVNANNLRTHLEFRDQLRHFNAFCHRSDIFKILLILKNRGEVRAAIDTIRQQLTTYDNRSKCIADAQKYYDLIIDSLATYPSFRTPLENVDGRVEELLTSVTKFGTQTTFLMTNADNLIRMIAAVICEE